ncbi:RNA-binding S4 domain-containing protein [Celeribacter marinus]|uniref:Ribosome-associated heat shock protein implicated in the recycling of the 50S subunit n=1 Tax=Celeribacter marinus TaxID=1397108 RepID=A0A0P0A9Q1_9RHOB|nr:RNA-binding S4 domain-containing protein [Celeribacter marinus]ALI54816.1 Ribosome-associated heat shock protein implicated in the recycling of the 50S subunit [Celeribacter marinus]SFJ99087.1 heat shock protein Hsp15 [Celeribacter marinus]
MHEKRETIRLDKWLWFARFFKTRSLATKVVTSGHVRLNSVKTSKKSTLIGQGDVLTFRQGDDIRVVEIAMLGTRRGPAPEAQTLYIDKTPVKEARDYVPPSPKFEGKGRPTKKDRRTGLLSRRDMLD